MELIFHKFDDTAIAEVVSDEIVIGDLQDALDLIGDASYNGAHRIIIKEENIISDFFRLSSGIAGEILQKCVNYNVKLAIIGSWDKPMSQSLRAFIIECNRGNQFFFVESFQKAKEMLIK